jgi:F-type H+-transporting ATPase subunit b
MRRRGALKTALWALPAGLGLLAAPAAAAAEEGGSRLGDFGYSFTTLLVFGVLVYVLGKYAWKPIIQALRDRETTISQTLESIERRDKESRELEHQHRSRMGKVDEEVRDILDRGHKDAVRRSDEMIATAREQARRTVRMAEEETEVIRQRTVRDLQDLTAGLAVEVAADLMESELKPEDHRRLLGQAMVRLQEHVSEKPA